MFKNLLLLIFISGVFHFFSCQPPDDFGELGYFSLDDPAYDIDFNVHTKIPILNRPRISPQYGVAQVYYGDDHFIMLTQQDSIICFNLPEQQIEWTIHLANSYWPTSTGNIVNGKFIFANDRGININHYALELSTGNILKSNEFEYPEGARLIDMQLKNENLLLAYSKKESPTQHKVLLQSWDWTAEVYRDLFSSDIIESESIPWQYGELLIEDERAYLVYEYELESEDRGATLFKFNFTSDKLDTWNLKGQNLTITYYKENIATVNDGLVVYANNDKLYAFDTNAETYSFIKTPSKGIPIENLKIDDGNLVVKYHNENYIIDLKTGNILLKPRRFNILFHPNKDLYFDRPVGNLRTLAIRDLASGQMLCEAEFGFTALGPHFLFYDIISDQIIFISNRFVCLMHMPEEL